MALQSRAAFLYYKVGQMVLENRVGITNWGQFLLQSEADITKRATFIRCYKVTQ